MIWYEYVCYVMYHLYLLNAVISVIIALGAAASSSFLPATCFVDGFVRVASSFVASFSSGNGAASLLVRNGALNTT